MCGDVAVQWRHQAPSVSYAPQTLRRYGFVRVRLPETNQIQILNTSTGEWREPVVCESGEDALKKAAQFVRGALLKGAKKL